MSSAAISAQNNVQGLILGYIYRYTPVATALLGRLSMPTYFGQNASVLSLSARYLQLNSRWIMWAPIIYR